MPGASEQVDFGVRAAADNGRMKRQPLPSLTGLRAVAALTVFASHVASTGPTARLFQQGRVAVAFFFVLSGFVLMWAHDDDVPARVFYRKRFARIYPAFLVAWIAGILVTAYVEDQHQSIGQALLGGLLLQSWTTDRAWIFGINGVSWSLSCEVFFYLTFPFWAPRLSRSSSRTRQQTIALLGAAIIAIGLVAQIASPGGDTPVPTTGLVAWLVQTCPATQLLEFALGAALAVELRQGRRLPMSLNTAMLVAVIGYLVPGSWTNWLSAIAIPTLPFAILVYAAAQADLDGTSSLLRHQGLVTMGVLSYCFYLTHQLVVRLVEHWVALNIAALALDCLIGASMLAVALHHGVERPLEKRLRHAPDRAELQTDEPGLRMAGSG